MASDLKFDIFAYQLFRTYWHETGLISEKLKVSSFYPEEYLSDPENADIYEDSHYTAVFFKHVFYHCVFYDELSKLQTQFEPSPSYISDYIFRTCRRDGLFGDLTIFELLLTSCAFVADLCSFCIITLGYKDVLSYVHVCLWQYISISIKNFINREDGVS
ncbi:hypothetical protein TNIN_5751 [Trichonephila inaurata madagascariensis]|uniref:Uncharacterized protein n=1 Tax=Trichonephila inaurata madagascariensis TaxID=2747483 RepID=A0A8X7CEM3_9ARAC|nr:hypothetical protein TNIN_5751 [Trichonephila inaurata madagascariensis]